MPDHIDVFLSSTSRDLADYRAAVAKVIADMNLFTIGMENFQPTEDNPVQVCYDQLQDAELFVGIYAYRYGYIPAAGMAYTGGFDATAPINSASVPTLASTLYSGRAASTDPIPTRIRSAASAITNRTVMSFPSAF